MLRIARLILAPLIFIAATAPVGCDLTGDDPEAAYMDDDGDDIGSTSLATTFSDGLTLNSYMNISGSYVRAHCAASKSSRYVRAAGVVQSDWNSYPSQSGYHQAWQSVQVYSPYGSVPRGHYYRAICYGQFKWKSSPYCWGTGSACDVNHITYSAWFRVN